MYSFFFQDLNKFSPNQIKSFMEKVSYLNSKITYCAFEKGKIKIFSDKKINVSEKKIFANSCKKLIKRITLISNVTDEKIIFENNVKFSNKKNVFKHLKNTNSIKNISPGIFTLRGKFLNYFNNLDIFLLKRADYKKYENIHVHNMLPLESFIDNGYLLNFPHHVMFASNLKRDLKFIDRASSLQDVKKISQMIEDPKLVMSPCVCYHVFETFKNANINSNKVFNSISSCNRFESINYSTFERLQSFTMREYIGFGSQKFIESFLQDNINFFKKIFIKNKIKFKIVTANDPFFSQKGIKKMNYQSLNNLKFELQFWLPNEKKWLAVGSFNNHLDVLTKKYKINFNKNNLHSGCVAWGYERFVYAIISQGKNLI